MCLVLFLLIQWQQLEGCFSCQIGEESVLEIDTGEADRRVCFKQTAEFGGFKVMEVVNPFWVFIHTLHEPSKVLKPRR